MLRRNLLNILLLALFAPLAAAESREFVLGVAVPLTGGASFLGENTRNGINLYREEHPDVDGLIKLVYEDVTTNQVSQGILAVQKLIETNKVQGLIFENSAVTEAAAPLVEKSSIPSIVITGGDCAKNKKFMVKLWMPAAHEAEAVFRYLNESQISGIALVTTEQVSMLDRSNALRERLGKIKLERDLFVSNVDEIPALAFNISQLRPQMVVINLMPGQAGAMARKLRELGYQGRITGTVVVSEASEIKLAQGALTGAAFPDSLLSPDFVTAYQQKYKSYPPAAAANGYDALKLFHHIVAGGVHKNGPSKIMEALKIKNFSGALGSYSFGFDEFNQYDLPAAIRHIQ